MIGAAPAVSAEADESDSFARKSRQLCQFLKVIHYPKTGHRFSRWERAATA
jgi:hypothetical protein